uniref:Solute carrier family 40 protein n=1 Tax=Echinococcus granulosus TaxID=6210 RepID=A0A068WFU3_ECHGR|nr:hypothetical protein EgrG_000999700 [Echinococcus granulosus]
MDGKVFLPSVFQAITACRIAGRSGFRWIETTELVIWALTILQVCFLATAFSVDEIFHQVFTLLTFSPIHGGVDFVPLNETDAGITLMLTVGLWKIHYSRAINSPRVDSSFQVSEAHFTVFKSISDVCLSSGLRAPYFAESARILLGIAMLVSFCNFFSPLFSRKAFLFTVLGGGLACMTGILMITIWLLEVLSCSKALSLGGIAQNASRVIYMRTLDVRPVILTTSFYHYLICAIVFVFETPFLLLKMKA